MENRFDREMKKGVLEMLVLHLICGRPAYGYELLSRLREGGFDLKEGTLYPILYRLEDDGFIASAWSSGEGKAVPKKMYRATEAGLREGLRREALWGSFTQTVNQILSGGNDQ